MLVVDNQFGINIANKHILSSIGYKTDSEPPARTMSLVNDYLENANHLIDMSYSYTTRNVEWVKDSITLVQDSVIFKSKVIARLLEQCEMVAIFAVTIGDNLEGIVAQLAKERLMLQATVLDAIGSSAVEKAADFVQDRVNEVARAYGFYTSRRFSPGYCDWDIGQQRALFWALGDDTAGISLTGRCLMIPRKSVSGIIGIGASDIQKYNPCNNCRKLDCPGRR